MGCTGKVIKSHARGWFDIVFGTSAKVHKVRRCDISVSTKVPSKHSAPPPAHTSRRKCAIASKVIITKSEQPADDGFTASNQDDTAVNTASASSFCDQDEFQLFQPIDALDIENEW